MAANIDKLKVVKDFSRKDILLSLARVPASGRLFLGSSDGGVYDVDASRPKTDVKEIGKHGSYVTGVALAGKNLVSGGYDGRLVWWDVDGRKQVRAVDAHSKWVRRVVATRDGKVVASVADDMVCRLWDAADGRLLRELRGHKEKTPHHYPSMLYALTISADGRLVATGDKVGHLVVWELATGKQLATLEAPVMYTWDPVQRRHSIGGVRSLAFSPDNTLLAAGGTGQIGNIDHLEAKTRVEVFDWRKGKRTHEFPGDKFAGLVNRLEFHPRGDWLFGAGGAGDGCLLFYDLKSGKALRQEKAAVHVHDATLNEAADTVYAVGHGRLMVFEMKG